jgi:hypothetical protein
MTVTMAAGPPAERDPAPESLSDLELCFAVDASNAFDVHHPTLTADFRELPEPLNGAVQASEGR